MYSVLLTNEKKYNSRIYFFQGQRINILVYRFDKLKISLYKQYWSLFNKKCYEF